MLQAVEVYRFSISGNHNDPRGNPIPYTRMTQNTRWTPTARRYFAWKRFVQEAFAKRCANGNKAILTRFLQNANPIDWPGRARTDIFIRFKGKAHADPDNILKGINDALFVDDNRVAVSADFTEGNRIGSVEVKVTLFTGDLIT